MTKPLFLICPGIPKCGTTMLWEIFRCYNTYIHCGLLKESGYLCLANLRRNRLLHVDQFAWIEKNFKHDLKNQHNKIKYPNSINHLQDRLPEEIYAKFSSEKYSLFTYAEYYLRLYDIVNSVYYGVGDFSTAYAEYNFTKDYLEEIDGYLSNFFTVKIVILFRDPVKRLFSYCHMQKINCNLSSALDLYSESIYKPNVQNLYPNVYDKFFNVFGDRVLILNELFFDPNYQSQREQAEKFLEVPKINIENLVLENKQNYTEILSDHDIRLGKELLKPSYDFYYSMF